MRKFMEMIWTIPQLVYKIEMKDLKKIKILLVIDDFNDGGDGAWWFWSFLKIPPWI